MYEKKIAELIKQVEDEHARLEGAEEQLDLANKLLSDQQHLMQVNFVSVFSRINEIARQFFQFQRSTLRCLCISKMPTIIAV